jgi:hypothetical protein
MARSFRNARILESQGLGGRESTVRCTVNAGHFALVELDGVVSANVKSVRDGKLDRVTSGT